MESFYYKVKDLKRSILRYKRKISENKKWSKQTKKELRASNSSGVARLTALRLKATYDQRAIFYYEQQHAILALQNSPLIADVLGN